MKNKPQGKRGRPTKRSSEVEERIIKGLCAGIPLTQICAADDMPDPATVWKWRQDDEDFSQAIARARETGFDKIALDALAIADGSERDTLYIQRGEHEIEMPDKEWILRSKLRVETRLKLLAKWDPKRYGDRIAQEISGPDGGPVRTASTITPEIEDAIAAARSKAVDIQPPGSFRGEETEK